MKLIYIASPYSHSDPEVKQQRFEEICKIQARLIMVYGNHYTFIGPIAASHCIAQYGELPTDWGFWKAQDECMISKCDEVWVMKMEGWEKSIGVQAEIAFAIGKSIPVKFFSPEWVWGIYECDDCVKFEGYCCKVYCESCKKYPPYDPRYDKHKKSQNNYKEPIEVNPKDLLGVKKVPLDLVPDTGLIHTAMAFAEGARKYGEFNWRDNPVKKSIYVAACRRHLSQYWNGEQYDVDSGVHNLGCAIACLMIILDAEAVGNIIDDAPPAAPITQLMKDVLARKENNDKTT